MLKKITLMLLFVAGLQMMPMSLAHAQETPTPPPASTIDSTSFMFDLSGITHEGIEGSTRQGWIRKGINYFFERIIGFMAAIIGGLSVLMLTLGGFLMLASAGNENMHTQGKNMAKFSVIGLAVVLSAYILVTLVQLLITSIYA